MTLNIEDMKHDLESVNQAIGELIRRYYTMGYMDGIKDATSTYSLHDCLKENGL